MAGEDAGVAFGGDLEEVWGSWSRNKDMEGFYSVLWSIDGAKKLSARYPTRKRSRQSVVSAGKLVVESRRCRADTQTESLPEG